LARCQGSQLQGYQATHVCMKADKGSIDPDGQRPKTPNFACRTRSTLFCMYPGSYSYYRYLATGIPTASDADKSISLQSWRWAEALQCLSRVIASQGSHLSPSLIAIRSREMLSLAEPHLPFFRRNLDQFEEFPCLHSLSNRMACHCRWLM
jgi:hypothetical protein